VAAGWKPQANLERIEFRQSRQFWRIAMTKEDESIELLLGGVRCEAMNE
jgi:hypothetical protein